jgi:hypothetical protein
VAFLSNSSTVRIYNLTTGSASLAVNNSTLAAGDNGTPIALNVGGLLSVGISGSANRAGRDCRYARGSHCQ